MEEVLNKLYSYEYFKVYFITSIIILIILFIIILFFGKKDQKTREIEATKRLQQLNLDDNAFKEEDNNEKVEVSKNQQEKLENDTIVVPSITDIPIIRNEQTDIPEIPEPVLPTIPENNIKEEIKEEIPNNEPIKTDNFINVEPVNRLVEEPTIKPLLEKVEEKPLAFDNIPKIEQVDNNIKTEEKEDIKPIEVPTFNYDEIMKSVEQTKKEEVKEESVNLKKGPEIFSSVYVPEKKVSESVFNSNVETSKVSDGDLDIELPVLKKKTDDKIEKPELKDYNFNDLSGETYDIK